MKVVAAKTKKGLIGLGSCLVVVFSLLPAAAASADTFPYIKEYGADVEAGGWFNGGGSGGCLGSDYQYPGYVGSGGGTSNFTGGILTYTNTTPGPGNNSNGGASSQYGAFALGDVDGGAVTGFYSSGAQANLSVNTLTFANNSTWGGDFGGNGTSDNQCIPDYYDNDNGNRQKFTSGDVTSLGTGQYQVTGIGSGGVYPLSGGTVPAGVNASLFVDGNVYISGNILAGSSNTTTNTKFALVVKGNIYIAPGVTELDGWYIAQPASGPDTNSGVVWTCHDNTNSASVESTFMTNSNTCGQQLVINGAVTAEHVNFGRTYRVGPGGGVAGANSGADGPGVFYDPNASEVINYTPSMVLGGSFFDLAPAAPKVESLVSLPPVF